MPSVSFSYGAFYEDELIGVVTIGKPASHSLCVGLAGTLYKDKVYELNRLYVLDGYPDNLESKLIGYALRNLKPLNLILVSYADVGMGHVGYVYQATNWMYTGETKKRTDIYTGKHSRHYTEDQAKGTIRKIRTPKHRYVYIAGDKRFKKEMLESLNYPIIEEYPKEEPSYYEFGESEKVWLTNKETGQVWEQ